MKILKIMKKYTLEIVFVLLFVVIQAYCDLELPGYTSNIVNVGVQQGGITYAVPEEMRISEFNKTLYLLNNEEKDFISKYYKIESDRYVLKDITEEESKRIDEILTVPLVVVYMMEKNPDSMLAFDNETMDFEKIKAKFKDNLSLMRQSAIEYIKTEYKALNKDTEKMQIDYIKSNGFKMILISLVALVITIGTNYLTSKISAYFSHDLRKQVVEKIISYSSKEFNEIGVSSLITRSTNDIQQIQGLITMILRIVIYAPIIGIGALTKVSGTSMSYIIGLAVLLIFVLVIILFTVALPKFTKVQKMIDKINLIGRELLNGLPVVRAFANEEEEERKFDKANKDLLKISLFVNKTMAIMMPTMNFIMNGVCILIIWVGAKKIDAGTLQVGNLLAFITYTMQIIISFLMISVVSIMLPRAFISVKRISEILNKEIIIKETKKIKKFKETDTTIEFKDVYFRYPDATEDVLSNISFKCKKGTTTAFIGSTGSGKSTLVNLIPRFFDVTNGKILVKGIDVKELKLKELRNIIGYVPQKGNLFSGSISSNIKFGKNIDEKELEKVAEISQSLEFIQKMPDKFKTNISEGGINVSGGQRQRLSIARAIAINPEIYIFDDSFSALDYETDKKLRKALNKYTKGSTILIVAQRISTVLNADQIIVMDEGKIIGIGTHTELYKNCSIYKEIALSQFGKEELK